jgi:hypothetical protein
MDVELLRKKLTGWTWHDVCESTATPARLWFYGRVGLFLHRPCVAVCALNRFVVMHYVDAKVWKDAYYFHGPKELHLDGSFKRGVSLIESNLRELGLKATDLVLTSEEH